VQRSSNFALNPLPEREHSETLERGDPNLLPEFVGLAEVGAVRTAGRSTLLLTLYHQNTRNIVNRVNSVYADTILNRIFTNAGRAQRLGLEGAADLTLEAVRRRHGVPLHHRRGLVSERRAVQQPGLGVLGQRQHDHRPLAHADASGQYQLPLAAHPGLGRRLAIPGTQRLAQNQFS
jgi:hypothetical protein